MTMNYIGSTFRHPVLGGHRTRRLRFGAIFTDAEAHLRKTIALQVLRPLETEPVHENLTTVPGFHAQRPTRWNCLIEDGAHRYVHRAEEELQIRTAVYLPTVHTHGVVNFPEI